MINKYKWLCHNGLCNYTEEVKNENVQFNKYKQCPKCLDLMQLILISIDSDD